MSDKNFPSIKAAGQQRILNVRPDIPDIRDRMYEPALIPLQPIIDKRKGNVILNQGKEGACTGFGLAAVINMLNRGKSNSKFSVSPRMLYEMAKKHDEWPGEDYAGSSCRGAIRGWKNMGVCSDKDWPYVADKPGELTIERAKAARNNTLGAYYRLRPVVNEYHAALNEVGAIYVSASVHAGWFNPGSVSVAGLAMIEPNSQIEGGHAFAIVGYNSDGFIVQNSWGNRWGSGGFALWLYEDWIDNISDGWVFRLAIPTPQIFGQASRTAGTGAEFRGRTPKRLEIAGHFVHFDDGSFKQRGTYWSTSDDIDRTAELIRDSVVSKKYNHLLIYNHGGLNSPAASAKRIAALKDGFKRNGIYPFHIMYDTGLAEELKDVILRAFRRSEGLLDRFTEEITDLSDKLIEDAVRVPVTPIWNEMKRDARVPFEVASNDKISDGRFVIETFARKLRDTHIKIHLAGHSTGAVVIGHILDALDSLQIPDLVRSCSLMAPACTVDFFKQHYVHRLGKQQTGSTRVVLPGLDIYNLDEKRERDDNVVKVYRKSLLFLVSRALERQIDKPILGMQKYSKRISKKPGLNFVYSNGKTGKTASTSHGGFDNDAKTMNSIMKRILGRAPQHPFQPGEMEGY